MRLTSEQNSLELKIIFKIYGEIIKICLCTNCLHFPAIKSTDMKKERTRNLLPAKVGIYGILGHTIIWQLAFSLKVCYNSKRKK